MTLTIKKLDTESYTDFIRIRLSKAYPKIIANGEILFSKNETLGFKKGCCFSLPKYLDNIKRRVQTSELMQLQ